LSDEKRQQILALGRLGWTLRRIEQATGVRRETAANYAKSYAFRAARRTSSSSESNKLIDLLLFQLNLVC